MSDLITPHRRVEAQSVLASTLVDDVEKAGPSKTIFQSEKQHKSLLGLNIATPNSHAGTDAAFAAKVQLLNQALLDIGMGKYQWLIFLMTGMGWFLDSVSLFTRNISHLLQQRTHRTLSQFWIMSFIIIAPSAGNERC